VTQAYSDGFCERPSPWQAGLHHHRCCKYKTHQADEEEEDLETAAHAGDAGNVAVPHRGHCHHQEVDTVPVGEALAVVEVGRIARVFQLQQRQQHQEMVLLFVCST